MTQNSTGPTAEFERSKLESIASYPTDEHWQSLSKQWLTRAFLRRYMYNFSVLGRPIIQTPVDMVAIQEIIWQVKPDLIIETGIAHGGSLIMSAAALALIDYCEAVEAGRPLDPTLTRRHVLGVDIDIRAHNRDAIEAHPMAHRIEMIQGSSVDPEVVARVHEIAHAHNRVLVFLDSNHTHEHVLAELEAYAPLTSRGSYCCVLDTVIEDLPDEVSEGRPWQRGNNPKTAVWEYLRRLRVEGRKDAKGFDLEFHVDQAFENKLLITNAPDGYLRRAS